MSSHTTEPGQPIEVSFESAFAAVPEVPAVKNLLNRAARIGPARHPDDGEALQLAMLVDAAKRVNAWWKTNHPNSLANSLQVSRGRRELILRPRIDGSPLLYGQRGYSASQEVTTYTIANDKNPYVVTAELCYADLSEPSATYVLSLTTTGKGSIIPSSLAFSGNTMTFACNFLGADTFLVDIRGYEVRDYASGLSGAPAKINQRILLREP
jgi:hypothetical protein